jgi:hypothetical protein
VPQQPLPQPRAQPRAAPAPAAAAPAAARKPAGQRKRNVWLFAGIGCVGLLIVCGIIAAIMPTSWWCLILTPLTWFGYNFDC